MYRMIAVALSALTTTASAEPSAPPQGSFQSFPSPSSPDALRTMPNTRRGVDGMSGRCERLLVAGVDQTAQCRALLTNMHYVRGQSIQFWIDDSAGEVAGGISFFGIGSVSSQSTTTLAVELMTIAEGTPPVGRRAPAVGTCQFGNFSAGPARVTCSAEVDGKTYAGTFVTDGKPPVTQQN